MTLLHAAPLPARAGRSAGLHVSRAQSVKASECWCTDGEGRLFLRRYRPRSRSSSPRRDSYRDRSPVRQQYATAPCCLLPAASSPPHTLPPLPALLPAHRADSKQFLGLDVSLLDNNSQSASDSLECCSDCLWGHKRSFTTEERNHACSPFQSPALPLSWQPVLCRHKIPRRDPYERRG